MKERLPLNVLLTRKCNASCLFCVEKTKDNTSGELLWQDCANYINKAIRQGEISEVLLLGGEPLYYTGIIELVENLDMLPIVTTNAHRLVHDKEFMKKFKKLKIKALNISIPHYDEDKRDELMGCHIFSNNEIKELSIPVRINTLLIEGFIDTVKEVEKMAKLCAQIGSYELKVGELTAHNPEIHDFIEDHVVRFNSRRYIQIPIPELYKKCHTIGGTYIWKTVLGGRCHV